MQTPYDAMWQELGLDMGAHAGLLDFLGKAYADIFLSQPNRPKAMGYFDFVVSEIHGLRVKELRDAKAEGRKVIATFCAAPRGLRVADGHPQLEGSTGHRDLRGRRGR